MGEKPLSIDEAPAQAQTLGGAGPLGGVDTPPPGMSATGINTTRSNIKHAGAVTSPPPIDGGGGDVADLVPEDPMPPGMAAESISTTRSNIKGAGAGGVAADGDPIPGVDVKLGRNASAAAAPTGPGAPEPTRPGDPFPADGGPAGIAVKEQGVKYGEEGDATSSADAPGVAGGSQPIPGVDIIVTKERPR